MTSRRAWTPWSDGFAATPRAARAEWWAEDDDGALELVAVDGIARGERHSLPLGRAGVFVLHGGRLDRQVESALISLAPIIRRRAAEERLARTTVQLARRNEALEDFAALVAHELKTPLQAALVADDPSRPVEDALDLVDALLEAAQAEAGEGTFVVCRGVPRPGRRGSARRGRGHGRPGHDVAAAARAAPRDPAKPALERRRRRRPARPRDRGALAALVAAASSTTTASVSRTSNATRPAAVSVCRSAVASPPASAASSSWPPRPSGGTRATLEFAEAA